MEIFYGIVFKDVERVIIFLIDLGVLKFIGDMGLVRCFIQYMLDNFMDKLFEVQFIIVISDDLYEVVYDQFFCFLVIFIFVM